MVFVILMQRETDRLLMQQVHDNYEALATCLGSVESVWDGVHRLRVEIQENRGFISPILVQSKGNSVDADTLRKKKGNLESILRLLVVRVCQIG